MQKDQGLPRTLNLPISCSNFLPPSIWNASTPRQQGSSSNISPPKQDTNSRKTNETVPNHTTATNSISSNIHSSSDAIQSSKSTRNEAPAAPAPDKQVSSSLSSSADHACDHPATRPAEYSALQVPRQRGNHLSSRRNQSSITDLSSRLIEDPAWQPPTPRSPTEDDSQRFTPVDPVSIVIRA
jgi:hypothetical protein